MPSCNPAMSNDLLTGAKQQLYRKDHTMITTETSEFSNTVDLEPSSGQTLPPRSSLRRWIAVSTVAWVVGGALGMALSSVLVVPLLVLGIDQFLGDAANAAGTALSFMLAGFAVVLAQWLGFRNVFPGGRAWLLAGAVGWLLAGMLASTAYELFLFLMRLTSGDPPTLRATAGVGTLTCVVAAAAMVGACQWLALRREFHAAGRWIPVSALAWSLGIGVTLLASVAVSIAEGCFAAMLVFPVVGGLAAAAITGPAFKRLAERKVAASEGDALDQRRWPALALAGAWLALFIGALALFWSLRGPHAALAQQRLPEGCPPACAGAYLAGLNLRGAYFEEADLSRADLSGARLAGASLSDANLRGANLQGARLSGAELNGADLSGADLRAANLRDANLREANLLGTLVDERTKLDDKWRMVWEIVNQGAEGRTLVDADLSGADLRQAKLARADLSDASLVTANLREADLREANLANAGLDFAELQGADLTGANLAGVDWLFDVELDSTTRIDDKWRLAWEIVSVGLPGADLAGVDLSSANLHGGKLDGANLAGANLSNAVLFHTYLTGANLRNANLRDASLFDAILVDADLSSADLANTILISAELNGARLDGAILTGARYSDKTIWPDGFTPPADAIKMTEPCFTDDQGKKHCFYG